jgi:hypothetical protein
VPKISSKAVGKDAGAKHGPVDRAGSDVARPVAHPPKKRKWLLVLSIALMGIWLAFLTWMAFWT